MDTKSFITGMPAKIGTASEPQLTTSPLFAEPHDQNSRPEFIRLPKPGAQCFWTGLSRSALNALILPTVANRFQPPVRSFVLRKIGAKTGIRLVSFQSLILYIHAHEDQAVEN